MKFKKEFLQDVVNDDYSEAEIIKNEVCETSRWSVHYECIFKYKDAFYATYYARGATEMQDEQPYEFDEDEIECYEVVPVEKTIIDYVIKK